MSPATRARPPPALPDDLVEEVVARFPPDDPALLVRAALVCKGWRRLLSSPGFRRRFRQLHRTPPLLGFIYHHKDFPYFKPTSSFRPPYATRSCWSVVNARHGRFLVMNTTYFGEKGLIVWDPTTDKQRRLPMPPFFTYAAWNAALLCAAASCDHSDCPWGPFLVVFVLADPSEEGIMSACVYSSEQGAWREPISVHHHHGRWCGVQLRGSNALVKNAMYFVCDKKTILEYDLVKDELSMISLPSSLPYWQHVVLMTSAENGGLGFASMQESKLCLWSRVVAGPGGGDAAWAQQRAIELYNLLPARSLLAPYVYPVAIADDLGVVFIQAVSELFTLDLRSSRVEKVVGNANCAFGVVPYTNFYTPALRADR